MIYAIMIFLDNGALLVSAQFERFTMEPVLITGFTTTINQFGLKIFPGEDLEDIVFTKHHLFVQKFKIVEKDVLFLCVHDKSEEHFILKKIHQEIYWDLRQKFQHVFLSELFDIGQLEPIKERIQAVLVKERRPEKLIN
nr:hypothetical protein [Candidatus Sigynarchaeota archaeon]